LIKPAPALSLIKPKNGAAAMLIEGFYRDGTPAGQVSAERFDRSGKADNQVTEPVTCGRCGGAGGADKWKHTGYVCFDCGGAGKIVKTFNRPIYTADRLAKLNAAEMKRAATMLAKHQAAALAAEAAAEAFRLANADWLATARTFAARSDFIGDVVRRVEASGQLTDGQRVAVNSAVAKIRERDAAHAARVAASAHVGALGERIRFTATIEAARFLGESDFGERYAITLRTTEGLALTYFGNPAWLEFDNGEPRLGDQVTLAATVKEHREFRGEKQTTIARPKEVKA
jgi:hypothetical protein